jgi:glycosyltransferase involved in cell wall biosynthesis
LRVLFASYRSHPQVGGQGVYVREVTRALADLGHEVTVVSGPPYPELVAGVRLERLPSLDLFAEKNALAAFRLRMLASWPDLAEWWLHNTGAFGEPYAFGERLRAWLAPRRGQFDVIHDNQGLYATLPALGLPTIATLHHPITVDLEHALAAESRPMFRALLKRWHSFLKTQARVACALPTILTVSQASKIRAVLDFGVDPARIRISPNGVDHDLFRVRPQIAREDGLVVSTVSADTPLKGLVVLIDAMAQVRAQAPHAKLQVVGELRDGPARRAIARHGLEDAVIVSGRLDQAAIAELYARAAVVVTPSLFEGFGLPTAEAMACGAPVVVTDGGALPEVAGDAGLVVPAGNPGALATAILRLLQDGALRRELGARGAQRSRARFSWRAHALAATAAYVETMAHAHHRP